MKVLVVSDDSDYVYELIDWLVEDGWLPAAVEDGTQGLARVAGGGFSAAVVDADEVVFFDGWRDAAPGLTVIAVAGEPDWRTAAALLGRRGQRAAAYIWKHDEGLREKLHDALHDALVHISGGGMMVDMVRLTAEYNGEPVQLSPAQVRILAYLMRHVDRYVNYEELGREALGWHDDHETARFRLKAAMSRMRVRLRAAAGGDDLVISTPYEGFRYVGR